MKSAATKVVNGALYCIEVDGLYVVHGRRFRDPHPDEATDRALWCWVVFELDNPTGPFQGGPALRPDSDVEVLAAVDTDAYRVPPEPVPQVRVPSLKASCGLDAATMTTTEQRDHVAAFLRASDGRQADSREIAAHFGVRPARIGQLLKSAPGFRRVAAGGAASGPSGRAAVWALEEATDVG